MKRVFLFVALFGAAMSVAAHTGQPLADAVSAYRTQIILAPKKTVPANWQCFDPSYVEYATHLIDWQRERIHQLEAQLKQNGIKPEDPK